MTFAGIFCAVAMTFGGIDFADHQAFFFQAVGDAGDVASRDHHALGQLAHLQALWRALELCHQVEPGQGGVEIGLQVLADEILDAVGATQHAQPQPHGQVMIVVYPGFRIDVRLNQFERALVLRH